MLLRLINDYAITADTNSYVLNKMMTAKSDTRDHVLGEEYPVPQRYYPSLSAAIRGAIRILQREAVAESDISTFKEAAEIFEHIKAEVEAIVFPGEEESV